jgi:hypothetical protein
MANNNDDNLELNKLDRFTKKSSRFMLEAYSHCEVPAGCGGVVLRWSNPAEAIPVHLHLYLALKDYTFYLNGTPTKTGLATVGWDEQLITIFVPLASEFTADELQQLLTPGFLMFALTFTEGNLLLPYDGDYKKKQTLLVSAADGSWKYSFTPPEGDDWLQADFDDSGWLPLVAKEIPQPDRETDYFGHYRHEELTKYGATSLGVGDPLPQSKVSGLWLRKRFKLERFELVPPPTTDADEKKADD